MTTKHFYKLPLLALLVSAGLLTACSSDDDNAAGGDLQSPESPIRIEVEVNDEPIVDTSDQARETRGTATTTATLSGFKMYAVYNASIDKEEYSVSKNGNSWTIDPKTWPSGNNPVDFYANTDGGTFNLNRGDPYVRFKVAENASTQHDLLVAKKLQQPRPTNGVGKVSLTFSHACAAVAFNVQMTKTLNSQIGSNLTVNSIKLYNVYSEGKYFLNSREWEHVTDNGTEPVKSFYTLTNGDITVTTDYQALSSNDIFVIPQSHDAHGTNGMYLEINYSNNKSAMIPLDVEWLAGYRYIVNIRLGTQQIEH